MKKVRSNPFAILLFCCLAIGCRRQQKPSDALKSPAETGEMVTVRYAQGFSLEQNTDYTLLKVMAPWPGADKEFKYALVPRAKLPSLTLPKGVYDAIVPVPVQTVVVTSTTHIPALESLGVLDKLIGFPDTQYVSSPAARKLISEEKIQELGSNESINTEMALALRPEVLVGFAINNQNTAYHTIENAGILVLYNGDWTEQSPLGKAEWIKFFGALFDKQTTADRIFNEIEASYQKVKSMAAKAHESPTVLSGALYKDVWYMPGGQSWAARFIADANATYLWKDSKGTGSLALSLETVLEKGQQADYWISPSQFTTYEQLQSANDHYKRFKAFKERNVYTFAATKGETGGLLYYELAPQRPDLVLKDLVHIFHPMLLPDHELFFFKPMQ
ncbi:ABC transporter substrate-binding protein [Flagellimonas lutaonensis]|nr:ABC transporter substrate-binding protein [Allomuricauda lutaonensis]